MASPTSPFSTFLNSSLLLNTMEPLTKTEEEAVIKLLQKRSKFVWSKSKCQHAINMLNRIRAGDIKLEDLLPGIKLTYEDIIDEQQLLKFCK